MSLKKAYENYFKIGTSVSRYDMKSDKAMEELVKHYNSMTAEFDKDIHEANYNHLLNAYNAGVEASEVFGWSKIQCLNEFDEILTPDEIHEKIKTALEI